MRCHGPEDIWSAKWESIVLDFIGHLKKMRPRERPLGDIECVMALAMEKNAPQTVKAAAANLISPRRRKKK